MTFSTSPCRSGSNPSNLALSHFYPWTFSALSSGVLHGMAGAFAISVFDRRMTRAVEQPRQGIAHFFHAFQRRFPRVAPPLTLGYVGGFIPLFEETIFNGMLRHLLKKNQTDPQTYTATAVRTLVNASLFSLCHAEFTKGLRFNLQVCRATFVSGLVFTSLAELTNNLWGSTCAHSLVNLITYKRINQIK